MSIHVLEDFIEKNSFACIKEKITLNKVPLVQKVQNVFKIFGILIL